MFFRKDRKSDKMFRSSKVHDVKCAKDGIKSPAPRIEISTDPHVFHIGETSQECSTPPHTVGVKDGYENPVFSIETVSVTSASPQKVGSSVVDYDFPNFSPTAVSGTKDLLTPRRGSTLSVEKTLTLLALPHKGTRRPSDPTDLINSHDPLLPSTGTGGSVFTFHNEGKFSSPLPSPMTPMTFDRGGRPPPSPGLLSTNSAWSELIKLQSRRSSYGDYSESRTGSISNVSSSLSEQLHHLVRAFSSRTEKVKEASMQPPTPSSLSDLDPNSDANSAISGYEDQPQRQHRLDSFIPAHLRNNDSPNEEEEEVTETFIKIRNFQFRLPRCKKIKFPHTLEPTSKTYMGWLFLVTLCFMYNAWAIPLRATFPYQTPKNLIYWLACDYLCDAIYILDIFVFKPRLTFLNSGLMEKSLKMTRKNYMRKTMFKFDLLSLLPLDLLYLAFGVVPWLRLPRILKIQTFWEFYQRCDQAVRSAHILRIIKTMTYMLFLIHIETCGYYAVSVYEGIGSNRWVYNGLGNAYIRCFYLATKTATSIGNNPIPTNNLEYVFMTIYWVSGVFVFALLIGQIRDIVDAAGRVKSMYNKRMDAALRYVKNLGVPQETQDKVRTWFLYHWQQQKIVDEGSLMLTLPKNLRTDLAIHVHFNTLSKVKLFQDCDKSLLYDLVLKLKPMLFLPGDYVCRKGEVGKEMYIVSQGLVEVVGGPENTLVLATLKEGSVFGEISLLALAEDGNRRTADVRCKGFTNVFVLSKTDFEDAMREYPEASKHLKKRAKKLLKQNAKLQKDSNESLSSSKINADVIIKQQKPHKPGTPKLLRTVFQVIDHTKREPHKQVPREGEAQEENPDRQLPQEMACDTLGNQEHQTDGAKEPEEEEAANEMTEQEVEEFYDEMLKSELMNQEGYESARQSAREAMLRRGDTVATEQSEASTDSGVQVKASSLAGSFTKTSQEDSKESFFSTDLNEAFEETCNWVLQQALESGEMTSDLEGPKVKDTEHTQYNSSDEQHQRKEKNSQTTPVHRRSSDQESMEFIRQLLNLQTSSFEGESGFLAEFFEDSIPPPPPPSSAMDCVPRPHLKHTTLSPVIELYSQEREISPMGHQVDVKTGNTGGESGDNGHTLNTVPARAIQVQKHSEQTLGTSTSEFKVHRQFEPADQSEEEQRQTRTGEINTHSETSDIMNSCGSMGDDDVFLDSSAQSDMRRLSHTSAQYRRQSQRPSSSTIFCTSGDYEDVALPVTSSQNKVPPCQKVKAVANGVPGRNQITCSVEVHREKSVTPSSMVDAGDGDHGNRHVMDMKKSGSKQASTLLESSL